MSRVASAATERAYRADWQLFMDWCEAAQVDAFTAGPADVLAFLGENPAGLAGQRRRVTSLNWMHRSLGVISVPGRDRVVQDALNPGRAEERQRRADQVARVLALIPSHGWPTGAFGRRDRALLVLSQRAGLSFDALQRLTRGDVRVTPEGLTLRDRRGLVTLERLPDDAVQCAVCAWARWLRVLDLSVGRASQRPLARALAQESPVSKASTHQCKVPPNPDPRPDDPVFIPLSRWGDIAIRPAALYSTSVGTIVRSHLAGAAPRHDPLSWPWLNPEPPPEQAPAPAPHVQAQSPDAASLQDRLLASAERRTAGRDADNEAVATLDSVEDRATELMRRTEELLALAVNANDTLGRLLHPNKDAIPSARNPNFDPA